MPPPNAVQTVAVIGAGLAGTACAAALHAAGLQVTLFDKSRGAGGRMSNRQARWVDRTGASHEADFDHGTQLFAARHPRFKALMARAERDGVVARWQPRLHTAVPAVPARDTYVALPRMTSLCRHLVQQVPCHLNQTVQRLQRTAAGGWEVVAAPGEAGTLGTPQRFGPFDQVMLATPPAQAAVLLAGHQDRWAETLAVVPMQACWTLMAVTDDVDWPWDAAEPPRGPLAWVARNDRKPGRTAPRGCATWVAQATPEWSSANLEFDAPKVAEALQSALRVMLPGGTAGSALAWHHLAAHRWRYAAPLAAPAFAGDCLWDAALGLGVCGDYLGGGGVEAAWRSGDELADTVAIGLETEADQPVLV
jgi:predicted NAD/FAD-dependent oxidoreductase